MIKLSQKEKMLLIVAVNNMQNQALHNLGRQLETLSGVLENEKMADVLGRWITETADEHDILSSLKVKIEKIKVEE